MRRVFHACVQPLRNERNPATWAGFPEGKQSYKRGGLPPVVVVDPSVAVMAASGVGGSDGTSKDSQCDDGEQKLAKFHGEGPLVQPGRSMVRTVRDCLQHIPVGCDWRGNVYRWGRVFPSWFPRTI